MCRPPHQIEFVQERSCTTRGRLGQSLGRGEIAVVGTAVQAQPVDEYPVPTLRNTPQINWFFWIVRETPHRAG